MIATAVKQYRAHRYRCWKRCHDRRVCWGARRPNGSRAMSSSLPTTLVAEWWTFTWPLIHWLALPPRAYIDHPTARFAGLSRLVPVRNRALWLASCWMLKPTAAIDTASDVQARIPSHHDPARIISTYEPTYQLPITSALRWMRRWARARVGPSRQRSTAACSSTPNGRRPRSTPPSALGTGPAATTAGQGVDSGMRST